MHLRKFILLVLLIGIVLPSVSQHPAEGFFTSETATVVIGNEVIVSIKKYNPTQTEIDNAGRPSKNTLMNYLMAPFEAVNISMYDKGFESKLYALDKEGNVRWNKTIGYSNKSSASPVKEYKGFLYTGESAKDGSKVTIQKMDADGKAVWQIQLDSLNNVNDIYVDDDKLSALVSFDAFQKMTNADGSFSEKSYPIYFFVQLDISTGKKTKQEYQKMANYLSRFDYSNPYINTDYSYFLNNSDSAIFFNTAKLDGAIVVSESMSRENKISRLTAGTGSYHLLTVLSSGNNKKVYNLITDFYSKNKKYQSELPVSYNERDRRFIYKTHSDSVLTIINSPGKISIVYTDSEGKSVLYKKIENVSLPVIAAGEISGSLFVLQMEGRDKPGIPGKIKIKFY